MSGLSRRLWFLLAVLVSPSCGGRSALDLFGLDAESGGDDTSGSSAGGKAGPLPSKGGSTSSGASGGVVTAGSGGVAVAGMSAGGAPEGGAAPGDAGEGGTPGSAGAAAGAGGVVAPPAAVAVAAGAFHSCALFDDGSVRCWGSAYYHGYGHSEDIGDNEPPSAAGDLDVGGVVTSIVASWYHTCALLESGSVRCWGDGVGGRLGYGNTFVIGDTETPSAAGDVDIGGAVAQISAGPAHTCAALDSGKVRCWGSNEDGQLGYPGNQTIGDTETPADAGDADVDGFVVQVAAGYDFSCALRDDGSVTCWGDPPSALEGEIDLGGSAVQVVAGVHHVCALLDDGKVRCWGSNHQGALGYGDPEAVGDDETPAEAGDVPIGGDVLQLAAGDYGNCALLVSGSVRCWGSNEEGFLGYGNLEVVGQTNTPADVGDVDVGGPVTSIDVGFWHTCAALDSGKVRCWGRNSSYELGYPGLPNIGDSEAPASAGDVPTH